MKNTNLFSKDQLVFCYSAQEKSKTVLVLGRYRNKGRYILASLSSKKLSKGFKSIEDMYGNAENNFSEYLFKVSRGRFNPFGSYFSSVDIINKRSMLNSLLPREK